MHHEVVIEEVAPRIIAVARGRATAATLTATIGRLYDALHASGCATQTGANVVVYRDVGDRRLLHSVEGVPVEAGFEVMSEFESPDDVVVCTTTPSGPAARTLHRGPYSKLPAAHAAIRTWCAGRGVAIAGPNWEIYGDWHDDPQLLETEVFYSLL